MCEHVAHMANMREAHRFFWKL